MKVLTFTSLFPNSQQLNHGVFIKERMKVWKEKTGNELVVVAPVPWFPKISMLSCFKGWYQFSCTPQEEVIEGIQVYHPRYLLVPKIGMSFHGFLMGICMLAPMKKLHKQYSFDLIDAHFIYPDGVAARIVSKALKIPYVISARGSDIHQFPKFHTIKPQIKKVLNSADHIISVSQGLKDIMVSDLKILPKKIAVIGNGVDTNKFYPMDAKKARTRCGLPLNKKIILSVGALIKGKNYIEYLKAISRLDDRNILVVIIGGGNQRETIEDYVARNNLQDRVIMKSIIHHGDLVWWYSAADLFCHPSLVEGWANVLMEAMACGLPSVATPAIGAREIITGDDVGLLTKSFKAEEIAQTLKTALGKTWDRDGVRKRAEQRDWKCVAGEVQVVFDKVLRSCK